MSTNDTMGGERKVDVLKARRYTAKEICDMHKDAHSRISQISDDIGYMQETKARDAADGAIFYAAHDVAELIKKIHDLGLMYEAGCDIDKPMAELEALAARIGGAP